MAASDGDLFDVNLTPKPPKRGRRIRKGPELYSFIEENKLIKPCYCRFCKTSNDSELVIPRQQTLQDTPLLDSCGNRRGQKASADFSDLDYNRDYELSQRPRYLPCELKSCNLCKDWFACDYGRDLWGTGGPEYYKIACYRPLSSDSDSGDEGYFSDGGAVRPLNSV